ncbi:uncharacterized protein [Trachinotus anak]|uniref:uncharacterized protein isoform X2 n=1 Tax=Trachinotus anak TaxID=443729 RepID=UPI0039F22CDD
MAPGAPKKSVNADSPVKKRRVRSEEGRRAKKESDRRRSKTRITIGAAITKWQQVKRRYGVKSDPKMALIPLDSCVSGAALHRRSDVNVAGASPLRRRSHVETCDVSPYLRTRSGSRPEPPRPDRCSSAETCESMNSEYPFLSSPYEEKWAAPFVQSSENGKPGTKDAALQRSESHDEWSTTRQSQNNESDDQEDDEEFSTSLSVGDGRYLVDLGSSSEFIVDEECILQLFKSCRECNKQCSVRKRVQGLKLVVYQACCFCESRYTWTNLPDEDEDDGSGKDDGELQINGKDTAHGQTDTAVSPRRNTS